MFNVQNINLMLSEGVKVYFSEGINPSERLSISDGVELMERDDYLPESYVPKEDFRQITYKELTILEGNTMQRILQII